MNCRHGAFSLTPCPPFHHCKEVWPSAVRRRRRLRIGWLGALLGGAGLGGVGGEVRGPGVVEEQLALRHVLAEVALHHAGVDEVFEERGNSGIRWSGIAALGN